MALHLHHLHHLHRDPSSATSDRELLFVSSSHQMALKAIVAGIEERKGLLVLCGESGLGKTTLVRSYMDCIDQQTLKVMYLADGALPFGKLLKHVYQAFACEVSTEFVSDMVSELRQIFINEYEKNRNIVLIIDNAHNLPHVTYTNLGLLASLEMDNSKLLQVVLLGQPVLALSPQALQHLEQHINVCMTLFPLTPGESIDYIRHRLAQVTSDGEPILSQGALQHIVKHAGGIPSALNMLCVDVLNAGLCREERPISATTAKEVIADFGGYSPGLDWPWELTDARTLLHQVRAIIHAGWHYTPKVWQPLVQRVADGLKELRLLGIETLNATSAHIRLDHPTHGTRWFTRLYVQSVCQCRMVYLRLTSLIRRRVPQTVDEARADREEDIGRVVSRWALAGSAGSLLLLAGLWWFGSYANKKEPATAGTLAAQHALSGVQLQAKTSQKASASPQVATAPEARVAVARLRVRLGSYTSEWQTVRSGEQIRLLQERLQAAGFAPGPIDGILGPQTQQAIRQFQEALDLEATGTLNAATLQALGF